MPLRIKSLTTTREYCKTILLNAMPYISGFHLSDEKQLALHLLRHTIGLKNSRLFFHPMRSKFKVNRDSRARVFPRLASATCNSSFD